MFIFFLIIQLRIAKQLFNKVIFIKINGIILHLLEKSVIIEKKGRLGYLTLNRPEKRNALSPQFVTEIKNALRLFNEDKECRAIIIKGNGEAFCAGADLIYIQSIQKNSFEENLADSKHLKEMFELIYNSPKLCIAQIEGPALAGGCGLATVCDFSFATPNSIFGYTEVKIGFIPAMVMVFLIPKIGEGKARELLLSGKVIDAQNAQEYGLINQVVKEDIDGFVFDFASKMIETTSALSVETIKQMFGNLKNMSLDEALEYACNMNAKSRAGADCIKGIAAFLSKEKLSW